MRVRVGAEAGQCREGTSTASECDPRVRAAVHSTAPPLKRGVDAGATAQEVTVGRDRIAREDSMRHSGWSIPLIPPPPSSLVGVFAGPLGALPTPRRSQTSRGVAGIPVRDSSFTMPHCTLL